MAAQASTDTTPPVSIITSPASGQTVTAGTPVTISGTASDSGGIVAGVEVSTNGGTTWHPATGRATWSYPWTPSQTGQNTLLVRAVDDSANLEVGHGNPITVVPQTCPCSVWNTASVPATPDGGDGNSVEVGLKFRADADGNCPRASLLQGSHKHRDPCGTFWTSSGTLLAVGRSPVKAALAWQQVNFAATGRHYRKHHLHRRPISLQTATTRLTFECVLPGGRGQPPLHALANGVDGPNGVYVYTSSAQGVFPTSRF